MDKNCPTCNRDATRCMRWLHVSNTTGYDYATQAEIAECAARAIDWRKLSFATGAECDALKDALANAECERENALAEVDRLRVRLEEVKHLTEQPPALPLSGKFQPWEFWRQAMDMVAAKVVE